MMSYSHGMGKSARGQRLVGFLTDFDARDRLELVTRDLWAIARGRTRELSFEETYRNQFNLVLIGHGAAVHMYIRELLQQMSRCMPKKRYDAAVRLIRQVSMHLDDKWCVANEQQGVFEMASAAWKRPVARRWRRALAMARWKWRIAKWRAVFTEVWLRPGGEGERMLAKRFTEYANTHKLV